MRKFLAIVFVIAAAALLVMQSHRPQDEFRAPVQAATIDARLHPPAPVQALLHQSCYNCHSEQGERPWYGKVWPASVLLQNDVRDGRARLDFSEWDRLSPEMSKIRLLDSCRMMRESKMPVWYYRPLHPSTSTPDPAAVDAFCQWAQTQPGTPNVAQRQDGPGPEKIQKVKKPLQTPQSGR
jgi:Haem-binding domain